MSPTRLSMSEPHLIAALVTPFTAAGDIDRPSLERLVACLLQGGIDEFFLVGSTGESPLLDEADRLAIVETVRLAAPQARIYAGVSGLGHRHALRNAREVQRAGADIAVLMSPFFVALDQEQLVDYCTRVAEGSPLPLTVYHHLRMPTLFAVPTVARLAQHPNIVALKDTNGADANRCADILAATAGRPFLFLQGVEKLVLPTLEAGGHGCVVAQGCIAPQLYRSLFTAWQAGDVVGARTAQERITALWGIFTRPEVRQSFNHFLHTLKLPLHQRGVLATTGGALPGIRFEPAYEAMITTFMQEHLDGVVAPRTA